MRIFVDTSAFFALLDRDDANHKKAKEVWNKVLNLLIPILKNRVFIAFLKYLIYCSRQSGQEDNHSQIGFFLKRIFY